MGDGPGRQYLDVILAESQRLERMVTEIESYVQFTSQHRPCFAALDLARLLDDALRSVNDRFGEGTIRAHWERPTGSRRSTATRPC